MNTATATIPVDPDAVFAVITDLAGLPDWNNAITAVVDVPAELADGAEWVVELYALGQRWDSRSTLVSLDAGDRQFAYRSRTDDGNPSWVDWQWSVNSNPGGCAVTVRWELHPVTFWRRVLFSHFRRRQLARSEVPKSLAALSARALAAGSAV